MSVLPFSEKNVLVFSSIFIVIIVLFAATFTFFSQSANSNQAIQSSSSVGQNDSGNSQVSSVSSNNSSSQNSSSTAASGKFSLYSQSALNSSSASYRVLFFHAAWCPSCVATKKDLLQSAANIPFNTDIFEIDYDSNPDLRRQYQIRFQHAFVVLDANNQVQGVTYGLATLQDIIAFTQSVSN